MKILWQRFRYAIHDSDQKNMIIFIIKLWMLEKRLKKVSAIKMIKQTHNHAHALSDDSNLFQIILSDNNNMINVFNVFDIENETSKK